MSYASQDAEPAKRICEALRGAGVEVWFDTEGGLEHGDEWDAKIRRQIKECVLFIAVISANTQAREEGYFRIEWELAAERAMGIASGVAFILPIVVDDTREPDALVPDRFRKVQWTRAPGGVVSPEVKARLLKLWSHRAGVAKHEAEQAAVCGSVPLITNPLAEPKKSRSLLWAAVVGLLAATGIAWWMTRGASSLSPRESSARAGTAPPVPAKTAASDTAVTKPALSPAQELSSKAEALLTGLETTREDLALAEEYCQRAIKLDPDESEAWAIYSQVCSAFVYRGWDFSAERREQVRVNAERAIRLAPKSVQARIAQAGAWSTFNINRDEREKLLREIVQEEPNNQAALRFLAVTVLARPNGLTETLALNERSASLPGGDPLALFNNARYLWQRGRKAEAYETLQRSIAQKPFSSAYVLKSNFDIVWRGDLAAAEEALRHLPESMLLEERANYVWGLLGFYKRKPDQALAAWGAFPRDYYTDFVYDGPKGYLLGLAHELAHRDVAAQTEWRTALQLVEKRQAATPNNARIYWHMAMLLACLGVKAAAGEALRTFEQLSGLQYSIEHPMTAEIAMIYVRLGRFDEVFAFPPAEEGRIRIDPRFDALRQDTRFEKMASAGSAPGVKAAQ